MRAHIVYLVILLSIAHGGYCETEADDDDDFKFDGSNDIKEKIASIRVRVTTYDPELCSLTISQHPFFPKCQDYCEKLGHWVGMCRNKELCYCYR